MSSTIMLRAAGCASRAANLQTLTGTSPSCVFKHFKTSMLKENISLMKIGGNPLYYESQRFYNRKKTIKIPPTKPLSFDYSGDLEKALPPLNPTDPKLGFEDLEAWEDADEVTKKLFSIGYADGAAAKDKRIADIVMKVKEHPGDLASLEVKIAAQTIEIRNQVIHCMQFRKDKWSKSRLVERIQKRKQNFKKLRNMDYEKFSWLLKELKIKYVPQTKEDCFKPSKRELRIKAAENNFLATKEKKLELFRQKLEKEKKSFLEHKEKELARIHEELKELGAPENSTVVEALEALNLMPEMKPPGPSTVKRRNQILEKKFELYTKLYKEKHDEKLRAGGFYVPK